MEFAMIVMAAHIAGHKSKIFLAGLEPATFHVLGGRVNHYTTETST